VHARCYTRAVPRRLNFACWFALWTDGTLSRQLSKAFSCFAATCHAACPFACACDATTAPTPTTFNWFIHRVYAAALRKLSLRALATNTTIWRVVRSNAGSLRAANYTAHGTLFTAYSFAPTHRL